MNQIQMIAMRIRDLRDILGLTQEETALKSQVPLEDYIAYEKGEKDFSFSNLFNIAETLGVDGLTTIHGRAEEAGADPALREQFDFATARAVADLRLLAELCLPFVKVGGRFLAMKGVDCAQELEGAAHAIELLGGKVAGFHDYTIPHTDVKHRVVVIDKVAPTPAKYPRRWAKIQKSPLV